MPGPSLIDHFAAPEDPRQSWKALFPLPEVLLLVLCGTLAGAEHFVEIRRRGRMHQAFLRRLLPFKAGVPSHDTLNDVVNAINGKTSRRAHDRGPLPMVSAWASSQRLVLGQQACEAKSNEITAAPLLLERLALAGALVTIDAMGTQARIAQAVLDRGGDYLLALKGNQSSLHDGIGCHLGDPAAEVHSRSETTDGDHVAQTALRFRCRIEARRHWVSHDVGWLTTARRFPGEPRFPGLRAVAVVEAEVGRNGGASLERRCFLSSPLLDAKLFAHAVCCHQHVENRLH